VKECSFCGIIDTEREKENSMEDKIFTWLDRHVERRWLNELSDEKYNTIIDTLEGLVAGDIGDDQDPSDIICPIVNKYMSMNDHK